jgi:hypothetical protein
MPDPPFPKVEVTSASGSTEIHPALPGTPEYEQYLHDQRQHRRELAMALQRFCVNYGIVAWHAPGEEAQTQPPEGWAIPSILEEYGVENLSGPDHRAQYLLYEIIMTDEDLTLIEQVIMPEEEVSKEDVVAALAPFVSTTTDVPSSTLKKVEGK